MVEEGDFEALYRERYDAMARLAYLMTGDLATAEDLVQDAFVAVHRSWGRIEHPAAYLRVAVVNACRSWGRRRSMERLRQPAPPDPSSMAADELWDVLQTLPARQRAAVVLRFYEDLPDDEIAELLGCRVATVRTMVFRALERLRKEVER